METRIAKVAGYCYGVKRAFEIVDKIAEQAEGKVSTLGPLIHNPQAIAAMKKEKGVETLTQVDEADEGIVVLRTHGLPPEVIQKAKDKGLEVIDATCPFVTAEQNKARKLVENGYHLFILGERNHPEVIGVMGHAGGKGTVIESLEDLEEMEKIPTKVGLVVQTTQKEATLQEIVAYLAARTLDLKVHNTICSATNELQSAARNLAEVMEVMLVIGGKKSGNTQRLRLVCEEAGAQSYHIETDEEINPEWLKGVEKVGVTAGASTPDFMIDRVVKKLGKLGFPLKQ
ncbi:4-hydroxy-3-methylbut-2-enyl diphosphate reductase [candidate division TA06 bacterium]|nr:4-hydroxy-3-methylbut-2-enyl diphosphate reductase [candidate division TA06 bacterium]